MDNTTNTTTLTISGVPVRVSKSASGCWLAQAPGTIAVGDTREDAIAAMTGRLANRPVLLDLTVGQLIGCRAFGGWRVGTVTKIGRTKAHVSYTAGSRARVRGFAMAELSTSLDAARGA